MEQDTERTPVHSESTGELVRQAVDEARELVRLEVLLAKNELRAELKDVKVAGIFLGACLVAALIGITMLLVAIVLAFAASGTVALVFGLVLVAGAAIAGFAGYKKLPRKPLDRTRRRLETDLHQLKERVA